MSRTDDFTTFIQTQRHCAEALWFAKLAEQGWLTFALPEACGGCDWSREEQIAFIHLLVENQCPVFPLSVTRIAPVIVSAGNVSQRRVLDDIRANPLDWCILEEPVDHTDRTMLIMIEDGAASLYLNGDRLGEPGRAGELLTESCSVIHLIHELGTTLTLTAQLYEHWRDPPQDELTELQVRMTTLTHRFLADDDNALLCLQAESMRAPAYHLLFESLGYYALLSPDPSLTANEALPFETQRQHLSHLRKQIAVDEVLLKDGIYASNLVGESR
jgi:hypothetical protein